MTTRHLLRSVLELVLGPPRIETVDDGHGARRTLSWACGCRASEEQPMRFAVTSCARHEEELAIRDEREGGYSG